MTKYLHRSRDGSCTIVGHPGFRTSDVIGYEEVYNDEEDQTYQEAVYGEPRPMTDEELVPFGYHRIVDAPEPEHDPIQQRLKLVPPEEWEINEQGQAVRRYEVVERPVPQSISAVQFRVQASRAGILDAIEAIIADPQTPAEVQIAWEYAREFERASPTIEALRQHPSIDLSAEEVDDLFRAAAQITV